MEYVESVQHPPNPVTLRERLHLTAAEVLLEAQNLWRRMGFLRTYGTYSGYKKYRAGDRLAKGVVGSDVAGWDRLYYASWMAFERRKNGDTSRDEMEQRIREVYLDGGFSRCPFRLWGITIPTKVF